MYTHIDVFFLVGFYTLKIFLPIETNEENEKRQWTNGKFD